MQISDRIGRRIKLQDLHILIEVVQAGSMGKAAASLNTSQPNISKSIAELEHMLGVRLLDRHRQGVEPTEYGRALLDGGMVVFDELRQTVRNIEYLSAPGVGEVRIGSIDPLAAGFVTAVIHRLSRRHPRIRFGVHAEQTQSLHRRLLERELDLLIARQFGALIDERLRFDLLFHDSYAVVASAKNPWVRRRRVSLAKLANEPWVLPAADTVPGVVLTDAMRSAGFGYPNAAVVTNSAEVRMNLLATGQYITLFSMSALRFSKWRPALKVVPVVLPVAPVPVGIVTLKNRTLGPAARLLIEHARAVAKSMTA